MGLIEFPRLLVDQNNNFLLTDEDIEAAERQCKEGIRMVCACVDKHGKPLTSAFRLGWFKEKHTGESYITCHYVELSGRKRCHTFFFASSLRPAIQRVLLRIMNQGQCTSVLRSPAETALLRAALAGPESFRLPVPLLSLDGASVQQLLGTLLGVKKDEQFDRYRGEVTYEVLYSVLLHLQALLAATPSSSTPLPPLRPADSSPAVVNLVSHITSLFPGDTAPALFKSIKEKVFEELPKDIPFNFAVEDSVNEDESDDEPFVGVLADPEPVESSEGASIGSKRGASGSDDKQVKKPKKN
ncbi:hypothetical protein JCM10213_003004 [Rhodosporidiobolus nylandii]